MPLRAQALILAAGQSRRFGGAKLHAPYQGRPLLSYVLEVVRVAQTRGLIDRGHIVIAADDARGLALAGAAGLDVVRRPTGGQALLHADEVTYSVVASQADPVVGGTLMQTYHAITEAFLHGLRSIGVDGEGAPCEPRPAAGLTPVCFASASAEEVLVGGRKLVASAQWRSRNAFLQHGSLLLTDRQHELPPLLRDSAARALEPMSVSLSELLPAVPPRGELIEALCTGFETSLGIRLEREA